MPSLCWHKYMLIFNKQSIFSRLKRSFLLKYVVKPMLSFCIAGYLRKGRMVTYSYSIFIKETKQRFPEWISLNSLISVNHPKIQKWYGYQSYYPSGNKNITSVFKVHFCYYLWVGVYCYSPLWTDANLQIVVENYFLPLHQGMYLLLLVTILVLDFVMIYWIQRKSFRENSNVSEQETSFHLIWISLRDFGDHLCLCHGYTFYSRSI